MLLKDDLKDYDDKSQLTYTTFLGLVLGGLVGLFLNNSVDYLGLAKTMGAYATGGATLFFVLGKTLLRAGINKSKDTDTGK